MQARDFFATECLKMTHDLATGKRYFNNRLLDCAK